MSKYALQLLLLILPLTAISQEICSKFTIGTFQLTQGPYKNNYQIIRTDSTQVDIDKVYNTRTEYKIFWVTECSYRLEIISGKGPIGLIDYDLKQLIFEIDIANNDGFRYLLMLDGTNNLIDTTRLVKII